VLYEQNIGALTPLLAERLQEAENEYPVAWIESAIEIAVANNVRKWRYVEAILEDWKTKGRDDQEDRRDLEETRQRYLGGEFAEYIKH
jgi:DnaD/phage-associated family protein